MTTLLILLTALSQQPQQPTVHSPQSELQAVLADWQTVPDVLKPQTRYMTSYAVEKKQVDVRFTTYNQNREINYSIDQNQVINYVTESRSINSQQLLSLVCSFGLNSLSQRGDIYIPESVPGTSGRIIRFYLSNYGIEYKDWEWFTQQDPYFEKLEVTYNIFGTYTPVIRSDWFLASAFYEPNYSRLFYSGAKQPRNLREFLNHFNFDFDQVNFYERDKGCIVDGYMSQVAYNKRALRRYEGILDYFHITYDFLDNVDKVVERKINGKKQKVVLLRNPSENLTKPLIHNAIFDADGSELIVSLPNNLQGYGLLNKQREIVGEADANLVRDTKNLTDDPIVRNAASCIWCHANGINIPGNNNFATVGTEKLVDIKTNSLNTINFLRRFYGDSNNGMNYFKLVLQDQQKYIAAVSRTNRLLAADNAAYFQNFISAFKFKHLDRLRVSQELGCSVGELQQLAKVSASKDVIDLFAKDQIKMSRENFENHYQSLQTTLKLQRTGNQR